jgi:hypothetical protein
MGPFLKCLGFVWFFKNNRPVLFVYLYISLIIVRQTFALRVLDFDFFLSGFFQHFLVFKFFRDGNECSAFFLVM